MAKNAEAAATAAKMIAEFSGGATDRERAASKAAGSGKVKKEGGWVGGLLYAW